MLKKIVVRCQTESCKKRQFDIVIDTDKPPTVIVERKCDRCGKIHQYNLEEIARSATSENQN